MLVGHRRDLGQVGHTHDLLAEGHAVQLLPYPLGGDAGDAGIDLVKDHGGDRVLLGKDVLHCQHDTAQLTAGGDAADAAKLLACVGGHDEADLVTAVGVKSGGGGERRKTLRVPVDQR